MAVRSELGLAHGFNMLPQATGCPASHYMQTLQAKMSAVKSAKARKLFGNGQHLCAMQCWFLYVMANVIRVPASAGPASFGRLNTTFYDWNEAEEE